MKTRLVVSVVSAVLAGAVGFFLVERAGDPKPVVDEVDRQLVSAFEPKPLAVPPRLVDEVKNITQVAPAGQKSRTFRRD